MNTDTNTIYWFYDKKTNTTYLSVFTEYIRFSLVFAFHIGDRVRYRGVDLVIRKICKDRALCFDRRTRFACWYELSELEVTDENKMVKTCS